MRVRMNERALKELEADPAVLAEMKQHAAKIAAAANTTLEQRQPYPDYGAAVEGGDNPHAAVFTRSNHAKYAEAKRNTLVRLVGRR